MDIKRVVSIWRYSQWYLFLSGAVPKLFFSGMQGAAFWFFRNAGCCILECRVLHSQKFVHFSAQKQLPKEINTTVISPVWHDLYWITRTIETKKKKKKKKFGALDEGLRKPMLYTHNGADPCPHQARLLLAPSTPLGGGHPTTATFRCCTASLVAGLAVRRYLVNISSNTLV